MPKELAASIRRLLSLHNRGMLTTSESANHILDLFADADLPSGELAEAFADVPDELMPTMKSEMQTLADADFYRRSFRLEDTRTDAQVHADALARQASMRRLYPTLIPLVLERERLGKQ